MCNVTLFRFSVLIGILGWLLGCAPAQNETPIAAMADLVIINARVYSCSWVRTSRPWLG